MSEYTYTIVIDPEPDGSAYNVSVPALPGCFTWGETVEEAIAMAKDAIALYLRDLKASGEPIPVETRHPQVVQVNVAA